MEVKICPYLDGKCGKHAQCVKCKYNTAPGGISRQKEDKMTNQDIFNMLSEIECALYYRAEGSDDRCGLSFEDAQMLHDKVDEILNLWCEKTGCYLK